MKRFLMLLAVLSVAMYGCGGKTVLNTSIPGSSTEKPIWASQTPRPEWTVNVPEAEGGILSFVGVSEEKMAAEQDARKSAGEFAIREVVRYLGSFFSEEYKTYISRTGSSSDYIDPSKATQGVEDFLAGSLTKRVKPSKWYFEKYTNNLKQDSWKAYVLSKFPINEAEGAYKDALDNQIEDMKKQRDQVSVQKAKQQFDDTIEVFNKMKAQGFKANQ